MPRRTVSVATSGTFTAGRRIVADQRERRIGRLILRLRAEGWLWREIAAELNRRKIRTRPRQLKGGRVSKVRVPWRLDAVIRWGQAAAAGFPRVGITTPKH